MTVQLSAVVLTKNEECHVGDCLDSLAWADERVIFDDFSTDRTVEIAQVRGARVVQHAFKDFASQRNAALAAVEADWILFVDADERATAPMAAETRRVIAYKGDQKRSGWWIPRLNYMIGHRMRGGGWYPDHQLRLLHRDSAQYDPKRPVHEVVILVGSAGYLRSALIHYNYDSVGQFRSKMHRYVDFEAQILKEQRVRVRPWTYIAMPLREFWRRFVLLRGYRDHAYGLLFCGLMAWYTFLTYRRLRQLRDDPKEQAGSESGDRQGLG